MKCSLDGGFFGFGDTEIDIGIGNYLEGWPGA